MTIPNFRIGHFTDIQNITGCTVVLAPPEGAVGGVDVRGPAPGTRETELLRTGHLIERAHAILLAGGSAFGLDAASGVMRYLEEQHISFDTGVVRVPIVPAAVLFDLGIGNHLKRPDAEAGYRACLNASDNQIAEGSVGAGTGATIGKLFGMTLATKSGVGYAERQIGARNNPTHIAALVVVNAFGDVIDPNTGKILAGARTPNGSGWLDTAAALQSDLVEIRTRYNNTTLGVVMTDAPLTTEEANIVAMMAHNGIARSTRPAHSMYDGDAIFVL
ncbi:MAG TPA: P1 family peptidase, partial [Anaerolineae bacterium]|nr:P1 family peptidase [Anaerolineae bacterium]